MFQVLDSVYTVTYADIISWSDAEAYCRSKGMYLWVINSHTERQQFMDLFIGASDLRLVIEGEDVRINKITNTIFIGMVKKQKVEIA